MGNYRLICMITRYPFETLVIGFVLDCVFIPNLDFVFEDENDHGFSLAV